LLKGGEVFIPLLGKEGSGEIFKTLSKTKILFDLWIIKFCQSLRIRSTKIG
jgi:hypothetical protein